MNAPSSHLPALCIDTISSVAGITVVTSDLTHHLPLNPQMASEGIIETIDQTLKKATITAADLRSVLVIKGPGSFTGLRVGISVANQFAHQLKIPILGLRTDEWWRFRSDEKKLLYLQSMNRAEVYCTDFSADQEPHILPLADLSSFSTEHWIGELKFDHAEKLPSPLTPFSTLNSIEGTWKKVLEHYSENLLPQTIYKLVEPFYGKKPNITKSKKSHPSVFKK